MLQSIPFQWTGILHHRTLLRADGGRREFRTIIATWRQEVVTDDLIDLLTAVLIGQKRIRDVGFQKLRDVLLTAMGLGYEDIVITSR